MDHEKLEEKQHELLHQEMLRGWDRQTQAFSFTIVLYAGALTAVGALVKENSPWTIGTALLIMSLAVPLIVFPIMCLFIDVEMYNCAVDRELTESDQYGVRHCGRGAIRRMKLATKIDLDKVANRRLQIFIVGPLLGLATSMAVLIWIGILGFPTGNGLIYVIGLSCCGVVIDSYFVYRSLRLKENCAHIRKWSASAKLKDRKILAT